MFKRIAITIMLIALAALACTPSGGGNGGGGNGGGDSGALTGELVYFSGRPPPEWTIPASEHADLAQRLTGLTAAAKPAEFPRFEAVAYGILNPEGVAGIPDEVLVQEGIIEVRTGDTFTYFTDDKQLETALRSSAVSDGVFAELGLDDAP